MKNLLQCIILVFVFTNYSYSQITITYSDIANAYKPQMSLQANEDRTTKVVNIGSTGSTSWNFSGLPFLPSWVSNFVQPGSTPYSNEFPTSNLAFNQLQTVGVSSMTYYGYYTTSTAAYDFIGLISNGSFQPGYNMMMKIKRTSPERALPFPATLNTSWTDNFTDTFYTYINSVLSTTTYTKKTITKTIDAYGPFTFPDGKTYQALRIAIDERSNTTTSTNPNNVYKRLISYRFLTKQGDAFHVTAADTLQPNSGSIQISVMTWDVIKVTDVESKNLQPVQFTLSQNYPNPFNPSTVINYEIPNNRAGGFVSLKIYDMLGRVVETLVNEQKVAGKYSVQWNASEYSSGIYYYELTVGNGLEPFRAIKKMMLVR